MDQLLENVSSPGGTNVALLVLIAGFALWKFRETLLGGVSWLKGLIPAGDDSQLPVSLEKAERLIREIEILSLDLTDSERDECLKACDVLEKRLCVTDPPTPTPTPVSP
jgi:hypothetical protein